MVCGLTGNFKRIVVNFFRFSHLQDRDESIVQTVIVLLCGLLMLGCNRSATVAEAKRELTGRWILNTKHDCTYGPVESDELLLHKDGRLEQHLKLKDGPEFDSTDGHWSFT